MSKFYISKCTCSHVKLQAIFMRLLDVKLQALLMHLLDVKLQALLDIGFSANHIFQVDSQHLLIINTYHTSAINFDCPRCSQDGNSALPLAICNSNPAAGACSF